MQELYKWIEERLNTKLEFRQLVPVERYFPDGPETSSEYWIHILVVTDESAYYRAHFNSTG